MVWDRHLLPWCFTVLVGCSLDSGGGGQAGTLGDSASDTESSTGDSASTNPPGSDTNSTTAASDSASATGSEATSSETMSTDSGPSLTTGPEPTTAPTSMGSTGGDPSTTSDSDGTTSGSTGGETTAAQPQEEHLQNADQNTCTEPLWCFYNGNTADPTGDETWVQECFLATLDPPFELTEVHWFVGDTGGSPGAMDLEVREVSDGQPASPPLAIIDLPQELSTEGEHTFELPNPVQIDETRFCVGFRIPDNGSSGAVGIAVNTIGSQPGLSWLRINGDSGCDVFPNWIDATTESITNDGNWCLDATIREVL